LDIWGEVAQGRLNPSLIAFPNQKEQAQARLAQSKAAQLIFDRGEYDTGGTYRARCPCDRIRDVMNMQNITHHFETIRVTDPQGLHGIGERLHDEYFNLQEIRYDEKSGTLEMPFQRICNDGPSRVLKNRFFYRIEEVDVLRGYLRFMKVTDYEIRDRARIGSYSFNTFHYDDARRLVTVCCNQDCELLFSVQEIQIEYRELEYRGKARVTIGWFWDSDSGPLNKE